MRGEGHFHVMLRSLRQRPQLQALSLATSRNQLLRQSFASSARRLETPSNALPVKKPIGAFRGGLFGFLFGATATGAAMYYYVLEDYQVSNSMLSEDVYALQSAVQRIESYVKVVEDRVGEMARSSKK